MTISSLVLNSVGQVRGPLSKCEVEIAFAGV
jgi:hypothetical protein